ncbi:MAG: hypothetical protein HPY82_17620 [Gammaproteobacteria bacterium]|nr:hypothetical protein [Gammaproteobacteria bacterium]
MKFSSRQLVSTASKRFSRIAVSSALALLLGGCDSSDSRSWVDAFQEPAEPSVPTVIEANIDTLAAQIGGATQDVESYSDGTTDWTLYTMANRFAATPVAMSKGAVTEISVPGYIESITVLESYGGRNYALLSMGSKGIGIVDITNPAAMVYVRTMTVNYMTPAYTYSDGGGTIFTEAASTEPHISGPVNDLLVDDGGTPADTTDDQLFIANTAFGIQKTSLSNLMDAVADGVVPINGSELWTLKYAGESAWGGPLSLKMHDGKLYAALGFLGIGIYNPADLTKLGDYNLYADCANNAQEDWFGYPQRKISCPNPSNSDLVVAPVVDGVSAVDADGMPSYVQAAYELGNKNDLTWYPWAEFDRYGKYYYNARSIELVNLPSAGPTPARTVAYIAYSLGGLVAVDVTDPVAPAYEGYVPAVPAHGPDEPPRNLDKRGILSHSGSGMLKEAGVVAVRVVSEPGDASRYRVYYTDHFAGLVVASGAESPATNWRNGAGNFNNDTNQKVFWPDYEFVTSFDMTPVVVGDESVPAFLVANGSGNYSAPVMLATGELNGHGGALVLNTSGNSAAAGQVDALQASGAGGVSYVDFVDLINSNVPVANRFAVPVNLVSTNEVGADISGNPGQPIAIGHTEGVTVSGDYLYLSDGPHGVTVWKIASGSTAIDAPQVVANTFQSEYPESGVDVTPTPHAFKVGFGSDPGQAYVMSQSLGMRRLDLSAILDGSATVGAPALLNAFGNVFEHSIEGSDIDMLEVTGQDHAYGVTFSGKYAIVADGDNGLTVYDTTADPATGEHLVANIGDSEGTSGKPPLGRSATVKLWTDSATGKTYAVVAAGAYGISVVDMTAFLVSGQAADLGIDKLLKTFEPLKADDDNLFGSADGKSVDVHIINDIAYFSYDSFGLVAYHMADLIRPATEERPAVVPEDQAPDVCSTITDVTKLSAKQGGVGECRPTAAGRFKLQLLEGYEDLEGGALYMTPQYFPTQYRDASGTLITRFESRLLFYVGYGDAGVVKLDWSDVANPNLLAIKEVVGEAVGTTINNGRVYTAANAGGLTILK